jgi:hypothetical protein
MLNLLLFLEARLIKNKMNLSLEPHKMPYALNASMREKHLILFQRRLVLQRVCSLHVLANHYYVDAGYCSDVDGSRFFRGEVSSL